MFDLKVENPCRCFFRSGLHETQSFTTKNLAQEAAQSMLAQMQKDFCKKHDFVLHPTLSGYKISIVNRS